MVVEMVAAVREGAMEVVAAAVMVEDSVTALLGIQNRRGGRCIRRRTSSQAASCSLPCHLMCPNTCSR